MEKKKRGKYKREKERVRRKFKSEEGPLGKRTSRACLSNTVGWGERGREEGNQ